MPTNQEVLIDFINKKLQSEKLSLVTINNGEVIESFDEALSTVMANCADINTTLQKRSITVKVEFSPSGDRSYIPHKVHVTYALAGMAPIEGASDLRIDANGAGPYAKRRVEHEQLDMFSNITPIEGRK